MSEFNWETDYTDKIAELKSQVVDRERRLTEAEERVRLERTAAISHTLTKFLSAYHEAQSEGCDSEGAKDCAIEEVEALIDPTDSSLYERKLAEARELGRKDVYELLSDELSDVLIIVQARIDAELRATADIPAGLSSRISESEE